MRNNLKAKRNEKALKQPELAFMANCSVTYISLIENNHVVPAKKMRQQLAGILECEEEDLFPALY